MPNTYSQIYIQIVFSVTGRLNLLQPEIQTELHKYISGIVKNKGQKLLAINSVPDHIHILVGIKPSIAIADLVRDIKNNSSKFLNSKKWFKGKFNWQEGYGAFSYSHSQIDRVINYINNQEEHHRTKSFKEEYLNFLESFNIKYHKCPVKI